MNAQFVPGQFPPAGPPPGGFPHPGAPDSDVVQKMRALNVNAPPQTNGRFSNGPTDPSGERPPKAFAQNAPFGPPAAFDASRPSPMPQNSFHGGPPTGPPASQSPIFRPPTSTQPVQGGFPPPLPGRPPSAGRTPPVSQSQYGAPASGVPFGNPPVSQPQTFGFSTATSPGLTSPKFPGTPPTPGRQISSGPGQRMPPPADQRMPPPTGQQMPPMSGQQMPPMTGQQIPPMTGQQMPPLPGQQLPPFSGQQMPPPPGQQMPPPPGQQLPPFSAQQSPLGNPQPYPGRQMPPPPGPQTPTSGPVTGSTPYPGAPPYPNQNQTAAGYPGQHQPGYPPQPGAYPGQPANYAGHPGQQNQYGYQPQTTKKLNPDQMPSPIQVMVDDQNTNSGVFTTNAKGRVPPLVTTDFTVIDQGNASPRYIRSSMYSVPATPDMMKQTTVPFCVVVSPMAEVAAEERPPPLLDFSVLTGTPGMGPVRCCRCKAYMCPAMKFVDAGRHFQCAFCKATTEVPMEYTQYLNNGQHYGQTAPEMSLGCYEIVATKEYCRNNVLPAPPALIFVVDVSYNAVRSGLVHLVVGQLRSLLETLPVKPRVGVITYSSTIHFYNINKNLGQPQMMVVGDIQDVFVPLSHGLLAEPGEADHLLDALAQQIPLMFQDTKQTETILLPAVQAGLEALKAAECCGKLLIFHSSLPSAQAPGQLMNRDDRKLLGTDKEKNVLNPQTKAYNEVAQECVNAGCGIEMFLFNSSYSDVATLGQLSRLTGGSLHKYTYFQAEVDGDRFIEDLTRVLSRPTAYDAVMRVRTSTGVRATDFYGHFFMSNTTDVELATLDCDKAIAVEIKHDDKLTGEDGVYIQVALLYTHATGQRRLRICNLALGIATQMADLYRACDLDTMINFFLKQAITKLSEHTPKNIKESIIARCSHSLACYRKHCATPSSVGQLVLPESMKLLPLYVNCLLRSDAVSGGPDMSCDDRSWAMQAALYSDISTSVVMLYPRLLCLNPLASGAPAEPLRCTVEKIRDDCIFLLENSVHMLLWIGLQTPPDLIRGLFGVNSAAEINTEEIHLPELASEFNERVRELIKSIKKERRRAMRLTIVRQHDKLEMVFRHFLVEDDGRNGAVSYMDFLCHVHKEIRALL